MTPQLPSIERAQGRPGARRSHGPRADKNARGRNHRLGRNIPAFPARMVLRLIRTLPGDRLSCPRRLCTRRITGLASAPGCQDHTTSPCASAVRPHDQLMLQPDAPIASHLAPRDGRDTPLSSKRVAKKMLVICPTCQADYFSPDIWTWVIGLKAQAKLVFRRRHVAWHGDLGRAVRIPEAVDLSQNLSSE